MLLTSLQHIDVKKLNQCSKNQNIVVLAKQKLQMKGTPNIYKNSHELMSV